MSADESEERLTLDLTEKPDYTWSDEDAEPPESKSEEELEELKAQYDAMKESDDD